MTDREQPFYPFPLAIQVLTTGRERLLLFFYCCLGCSGWITPAYDGS
jgi:hypothetical protein